MSRIRAFDTALEIALRTRLWKAGVRYRTHSHKLPGRPDLVFTRESLLVFIDGDFWHGFRFPAWRSRLSSAWQAKIERNRRRDQANRRRLRRLGWHVMRVWEHELHRDPDACAQRVLTRLGTLNDASASGRTLTPGLPGRDRKRQRVEHVQPITVPRPEAKAGSGMPPRK
jgi:DNA mismatch endonuclease (patch repair protein)